MALWYRPKSNTYDRGRLRFVCYRSRERRIRANPAPGPAFGIRRKSRRRSAGPALGQAGALNFDAKRLVWLRQEPNAAISEAVFGDFVAVGDHVKPRFTALNSGKSKAIGPALSVTNRTWCSVRNSTSGTGQPLLLSTTSIRQGAGEASDAAGCCKAANRKAAQELLRRKFQIPNSKFQKNSKFQIPRLIAKAGFTKSH